MTRDTLQTLLERVARGELQADQALRQLERLPFEDLGYARIDHHRDLRCGFPEVIFGQGKTVEQFLGVFEKLVSSGSNVLATRVEPRQAEPVTRRFEEAVYHELSRTLRLRTEPAAACEGFIGLACAGTSDLPVAEEARITAEMMDQSVRTFYDVGVAGLHRLLAQSDELRQARVLIVVAGMEGALPSVVGGLVRAPVIAVPTSVGYGASFGGLSALLAMLNSCAAGVSVVNIDNGFGAGYQAALINRLAESTAAQQQPADQSGAQEGQ